jgi:excisionase family DNA binding protein
MNIVTVKEIATLLKVSPKTIYQWAELNQIPYYKINGALRFDLTAVSTWLHEKCLKGPVTSDTDSSNHRSCKNGTVPGNIDKLKTVAVPREGR